MTRKEKAQYIIDHKLVVIIRAQDQSDVSIIIKALVESGVKVLEVTSNTPGFEQEITEARKRYPDVLIGAGTIISTQLAQKAVDASAQFLVTPSIEPEVAAFAHEHDIPVLMGALTPTDVSAALKADTDIIKLFPADILGIDYMKAIMGPFDKVSFFAVGGIGNENAKAWMDAGAKGLGVGGKLTKLNGKNTDAIEAAAKELLGILNETN